MIKKRREQCIVLLDEGLDSERVAAELAKTGYCIERFVVQFPQEDNPARRETKVKDSRVITRCHQRGYLLFTVDHEMRKTFIRELRATDIGVVATANNADGIDIWIKAFQIAKVKILRDFKKSQRPYFSILTKSGNVRTDVIGPERTNRRTRTRERDDQRR